MKSFEDMKAEMSAKWTGFTVKVKTKVHETYVWVSNNKEEAAVLIGIGSSLIFMCMTAHSEYIMS